MNLVASNRKRKSGFKNRVGQLASQDCPSSSAMTELWVSIAGSHGFFLDAAGLSITSLKSSIQNWKGKGYGKVWECRE